MINYAVGDMVKITPMYLSHYLEWGPAIKDKPAKVVGVKSWKVYQKNLGREDKALFQSLYGVQAEYDLIELMIDIEGTKFIVSQFGFAKV